MKKKLKTVAEEWNEGAGIAGLENMPDHIVEQMKVFFYSGVHAALHMNDDAQKGCESMEEYKAYMDSLHDECLVVDAEAMEENKRREQLLELDQIKPDKKMH